jgi:hypothetical protein
MNRKLLFAVTALCFITSASADAADYVFGSFEGTTLGGGWGDWGGSATFSNSTTGATVGTMSIKQEPGAFGFYQGLSVKLQDLPDNAAAFAGFTSNTHVAIDVTFNTADFEYIGDGWNGGRLLMFYNEQGAGYQGNIGVDIGDANGFRVPNIDTGNATNPGFWDITNYPGVHTRTMMWDYSQFLPALTATATGGWTEFFIGNNLGNFNTAAFYMDNFRFTTPAAGAPGDFDGDDDVDGRDFLAWQRGGSPTALSAGDLADWQNNYGETPGLQASISAVPEPTSAILVVVMGAAVALARRKRHWAES